MPQPPDSPRPRVPAAMPGAGTIRHVVVMGVSGCGKSTLGQALAGQLGWVWTEGDLLHPDANIRKMAAGLPLNNDDRLPWLHRIAREISKVQARGMASVTGCSALRQSYRNILRAAAPGVAFLHLDGPRAMLKARISSRTGHFFPAALLDSQLATLEPLAPDEAGLRLDLSQPADRLIRQAIAGLGLSPAET